MSAAAEPYTISTPSLEIISNEELCNICYLALIAAKRIHFADLATAKRIRFRLYRLREKEDSFRPLQFHLGDKSVLICRPSGAMNVEDVGGF